MVVLVVLVVIIAVVAYIAAQPAPEPKRQKPERAQKERDIPLRKAGTNINVPGVTPIPVEPVSAGNGTGFIESGSPEDWAGDMVLARRIDIARSDFWIKPEATLFPPGAECLLEAKIVDADSQPLEGVPVVWMFRAGNRRLNKLPVRTDAQGVATFVYTVKEEDQSGDPASPEPDSGSFIVDCYAGARRLVRIRPLHDTY